jgi:hypothetical protein
MAKIEIVPCSYKDIIPYALKYKHNTLNAEQSEIYLKHHCVEAFRVLKDGIEEGVVFSSKIGDKYTLDGYYSGVDAISSIKAGKMMCERIFKHTDEIYTMHRIEHRGMTAVTIRIGFKEIMSTDEMIMLINRWK